MSLKTPHEIRELQRALYRRAKREPTFRFYTLYDKVYRTDILEHAYRLAKAKGGAPGPDGQTFEDIEQSGREEMLERLREELRTKQYRVGAVRRVYIPKLSGGKRPLGIPTIRDRVVQTAVKLVLEPIFEADFDAGSYGFRPERSAHQALETIGEALKEGMNWVIDADIEAYFDTIPHDRLMKTVAERVVDGAMLALIKMFLEAPIIEEDGGGARRNPKGTPQGGVISPLLANIYLNLMDRNYRRRVERRLLRGRLVRYADDFVMLVPRRPEAEMAWLKGVMERLGLVLHPDKTRTMRAGSGPGQDDFDFLGHRVRYRYNSRVYLDISKKALGRIREQIRARTRRTGESLEEVITKLNLYIKGARQYFDRVRRRTLMNLDSFVRGRIARWWARKHAQRQPAWSLVLKGRLEQEYGLQRWYIPKTPNPAHARRVG